MSVGTGDSPVNEDVLMKNRWTSAASDVGPS